MKISYRVAFYKLIMLILSNRGKVLGERIIVGIIAGILVGIIEEIIAGILVGILEGILVGIIAGILLSVSENYGRI